MTIRKHFLRRDERTGYRAAFIVTIAIASAAGIYGLMSGIFHFMRWAYLAGYAPI